MKHILISLILFFGFAVLLLGRSISPVDMGLNAAADAEERYMVLYQTHKYALDNNLSVNYSGISHIDIAVPSNAPSIPLGKGCDFMGVTINVLNNVHPHTLFVINAPLFPIKINARALEEQEYKSINQLKRKKNILIIKDQNPWGDMRQGFSYYPERADIIYIKRGYGKNTPIRSYDNFYSNPVYYYCPVDRKEKCIKNITINRDAESTCLLFCFKVENQNNISLSNITINTPENKLYGDQAISILNCTNVVCEGININGTYSQFDKYGYGIYMNNVWNSKFLKVHAKANWGIFGTNNISDILLEDCDINRFDIHSYGRNVICSRCTFRDLYNQYSSVYGVIKYDECRFINSIPVMTEYSYNSYVGYELILDNCIFEITSEKNSIVNTGRLHDVANTRPELQDKSLPNVSIKNLLVIVPPRVNQFNLFQFPNSSSQDPEINYISRINISGMEFRYEDESVATPSFYLISSPIQTKNNININISDMNILPDSSRIPKVSSKYFYPYSVIVNFNKLCPHKSSLTFSNSRLNYNTLANNIYDICYNKCFIGLVRYNSNIQGRRIYKECNILLNCVDDEMYYIDNNADYLSCTFYLANPNFKISFTGVNNNVHFYDCVSASPDIFSGNVNSERVLKDSYYINNQYEHIQLKR